MKHITATDGREFPIESRDLIGTTLAIEIDDGNSTALLHATITHVGPDFVQFDSDYAPTSEAVKAIMTIVRGEQGGKRNGRSST